LASGFYVLTLVVAAVILVAFGVINLRNNVEQVLS
jgi:hypothetical protein